MVRHAGSGPRSRRIVAKLSSPPWSGSMSMATMPLGAPVRMATLAFGQLAHHRLITATSLVASVSPPLMRGCLAGELQSARQHVHEPGDLAGLWHGKTSQPRRA